MNKPAVKDFLVAITLLVSCTLLIAATGLDLSLAERFYAAGSGWFLTEQNPWRFLYHYGVIPAYLLAGASLVVLCAGFVSKKVFPYRKCALFCVLLMLIGPGLIVNTVFKDHWGRPRPRQMQLFGGDRAFHQVWERGVDGKGRSFPSGHASAAFYLMAPYFVLRARARRRALCFLAAGGGYGVFMGVARIVQGGHFLSDVLWAGGTVYLVGLSLYYLLRLDEGGLQPEKEPSAG